MLNFILPDHEHLRQLNYNLFSLKVNQPDWFLSERNIYSVYGQLTCSKADGGRQIQVYNPDIILKQIIQDYQSFGINYSHVLSNDQLTPQDIKSDNLNTILGYADYYKNNVILTNIKLSEYISQNYPNILRIGSVIRLDNLATSLDLINSKIFHKIVINPIYNYWLDKVPENARENIIVLTNDCCPNNCPNKRECYEETFITKWETSFTKKGWGQYQLGDNLSHHCHNQGKLKLINSFPDAYGKNFIAFSQFSGVINPDDYILYDNLKINYIKIEGRCRPPKDLAFLYAEIFAKPEYRIRILYDLLGEII